MHTPHLISDKAFITAMLVAIIGLITIISLGGF